MSGSEPPVTILSIDQLEDLVSKEPKGWIWDTILPRVGVGLVCGPPRAGKSTLIACLAAAMAKRPKKRSKSKKRSKPIRVKLAGKKVMSGSSLLANLEHAHGETFANLEDAARGIDAKHWRNKIVVVRDLDLSKPEQVDHLDRKADEMEIKLLAIDSYIASTRYAEENSSTEVRGYFEILRRLSAGKRLVLVTHHTPKKADGPRGSGDFMAAPDFYITVEGTASGVVTLKTHPHRGAPQTIKLRVERTTDPSSMRIEDADACMEATKMDDLSGRILRVINGGNPKGKVTKDFIRNNVNGDNTVISGLVEQLVEQGRIENAGTTGRPNYVPC